MLKIWRFCAVLFTTILFGFSANAAIDCTNMEPEFSVTINMTSASNFSFSISAAGDFCIDWGDGTIENKPKDTSNSTYSHPYEKGTYTIGISGDATAYNTGTSNAAISFSGKTQVTNISGSLGAIFPTLSDGTQPRFVKAFYACKNLTGTITSDLFDGIHGQPTTYMFQSTFENCDNLSGELPYGLFDDLSGTLTTKMFYRTFKRNALSGTLTPAFFGGLTIDDWNSSALEDMFDADAELATSCPDGVTAITNSLNVTLCESAGTPSTPTCDAGYWLNGNTCEQCPNGYTSPAGATAQNQCYTTCATDCVQPTCPDNATCSYSNESASGNLYYGTNSCDATAPTCSMEFTCNENFEKVDGACKPMPEFTIETVEMAAGSTFSFDISASGIFYVDFDDGRGAIKIDRTNNTTNTTYTSAAYSTAGTHKIRFAGDATGYTTENYTAAISFNGNTNIKTVDGSLGAIFSGSAPYMFTSTFRDCTSLTSIPENLFAGVSGSALEMFSFTFYGCGSLTEIPEKLFAGVSGSAAWMFAYTFYNCTSLTGIPENLFAGVSGSANNMFYYTFMDCTSLTSIPENLFAGVSGSADYMFYYTFYGCTSLTSIPENLFAGVSGSAYDMFGYTFYNCTSLTSIPETLFAGVSGSAGRMFDSTFRDCTSLTSIPENLFAGVTGSAPYMFYATFYNCTSLTSLPDGLFKNIEGKPAKSMFQLTFYGCTKLSGYIPANTFEKMDSTGFDKSTMSAIFYNTALATTCPAGTTQYFTGFESAWNGHVACTPCPDGYTSPAGATSQNQCYTECTVDCEQSICPENATCAYGSETATGTQNWGGTCNATAPTCPVTITCNAGYWLNGDTCEICPAGSYCANNIKTECESGTYTDTTGQTSCTICPVGSYCAGGIKLECVAGTYTDTTRQSECAICPIGSYCVGGIRRTCPDGQFTDETQRTTCTICPIGSACSNGIRAECPDGQYTNATGQTVCTSCPMGSYCTAGIINQCVGGTYSDAPGMSACTTCPDGTTSVPGAISVNQCGNTKVLHIGDTATMNLFTVRPEQKPYMVFDINGVQYYGEMSTTQTGITDGSDVKFKILHNDTEYYLHDFSAK